MPTTSVCDEWRGQLAAYKEQLAGDIMEMKSFILSGHSFPSERAQIHNHCNAAKEVMQRLNRYLMLRCVSSPEKR